MQFIVALTNSFLGFESGGGAVDLSANLIKSLCLNPTTSRLFGHLNESLRVIIRLILDLSNQMLHID